MRVRGGRGWAVVAGLAFVAAADAPAAAADPASERASIYSVSPVIDGAVIVGGALASLIPYALSSRLITPHCPCRASDVNGFDRGVIGNASDAADRISTVTVALTLAAPITADFLLLASKRTFVEDVTVLAEAVSVSSALVTLAKYTTQRPIPRVYSDPTYVSSRSNYRSFYSGHASLAFTALTVASVTTSRRYGLRWPPWLITALVGGSVAAERVLAGVHFYTDVLAGAAAGIAVGGAVTWAHLRQAPLRISAAPPALGSGALLVLAGAL
jgi:membrane-associated phospholipid phosphatase